ncbi:DUF1320 domain-containing protein [bacterium]|nr:DUF1320 domain-containing protein [bacterium]
MGSYIDTVYVEGHIRSRHLVELTDTKGGSDVIDSTIIDDAISFAESMIEMKIAKYYVVPVTGPARILNILRFWSLQLVLWRLYQNLMKAVPEHVQVWYDDVMDELDKINKGEADLTGAGAQSGPAIAIAVDKTSNDVVYTQDTIDLY